MREHEGEEEEEEHPSSGEESGGEASEGGEGRGTVNMETLRKVVTTRKLTTPMRKHYLHIVY